MWWLFKKKKNEEKQIQKKKPSIEEQRALYQKRKQYLTQEKERVYDKIYEEKDKSHERSVKEAERHNNNCPHCKGTDIIQVFHQQEGNISGHSSSYHGMGSGSVSGKIKTLKVNKCKICGQEWEYKEVRSHYDSFSSTDYALDRIYRNIWNILDLKYDPSDISETFNSLEEKQKAEIEKIKNYNFVSDLLDLDLSIEFLAYYLARHSYDFSRYVVEDLGNKVENDKEDILYEFKPKNHQYFKGIRF